MKVFVAALIAADVALAFPFVADTPGVDSSFLGTAKRNADPEHAKRATCPFNPNHRGAAAYNSQYPYTGARNGAPGSQVGGVKVPADGDTAHAFEAPGPNDIRGPCPGLNAAANHNVRRPAPWRGESQG
jgi:unspecific peroxygenase